MPRRLLSLMTGLALASAVWAADTWPQWRGPNRDGASTAKGLLDHWEKTPPLVWKAKGLGHGYAGVVVDGGIVCTMGVRKGKTTVIAVSDKDGKEIWGAEIGPGGGEYSAMCTPTIDGERLYAVSGNGILVCLKTATGERLWQKDFKKDYDGHTQEAGYAESPLIDGDTLICSPGGAEAGIVALDKKTGEELWRCPLSFDGELGNVGATYSSVVISHGAGVKQYVQLMRPGLVSIDAKTGKQLWSYSRLGAGNSPCTSIVRGDYVFAPCGWYNGSALLKLVPTGDGGVQAKEVYLIDPRILATNSGGAVLVGDYVYGSHVQTGMPQCIELMTGKLMWDKGRGPGSGPAAVFYADGHLYYPYESGVIALVAATPDKYQLKGRFHAPGFRGLAHPAISNGRLYLRSQDAIYCYDLRKK